MIYYSLKNILSKDAQYNIIIGERSNGKTYAALKYAIEKYAKSGEQSAIVRRWLEDLTGKRGAVLFDALAANDEIRKATRGKWSGVYYYSSRWYLSRYNEKGARETDKTPFAFAFSLSTSEHDKSASYNNITTVIFDEFLTRNIYLPDEYVLFMNLLSTIIRDRDNVKIFLLGNTLDKFSPYFKEFGLVHILDMKPGNIDIYQYGESALKVAVEYTPETKGGKKSDIYFAFNNPKLNMIKRGEWEIGEFPHCPAKYRPKDIVFIYFIQYGGETLQCEIINTEDSYFTYIHRKTTPIRNPENDLIYTLEYNHLPNYRRKITQPRTPLEQKITEFFIRDKVFFQDNSVGNLVYNYIKECGNPAPH